MNKIIQMNDFRVEDIVNEIVKEIGIEKIDFMGNERYKNFLCEVKKHNQIVIVGAGEWGRSLYERISTLCDYNIECFGDNSYEKYRKELARKPILSLEEAVQKYPEAVFIITPRMYRMSLIKQLVKLDVSIDQILIYEAELMGLIV